MKFESRKYAPLAPMTRPHEMVERISTKEYPYKMTLMDEETQDSHLVEFGAACTKLPSTAPQQMWHRVYRKGH